MEIVLLLPRMLLFRPARGSLMHSQPAAGDAPRTTTMRPTELPAPCHWCKLVNCLRPDKHWKELPWHHAHQPPREGLSREVQQAEPAEQFELEPMEFLTCLRKARRGAAPGPSGMTPDHLFPLLESEADSELFTRVGSLLAVARVPHVILEAIRVGAFDSPQQA